MTTGDDGTATRLEEALADLAGTTYALTLFVSGASNLSARAIANARQLCETHLHDRYDLAIVDIHEHPDFAVSQRVVAAPTLVRNQPLPVCRLVGDLSETDRVLHTLGLPQPETLDRDSR
jgi:circadian clock protein KaiB